MTRNAKNKGLKVKGHQGQIKKNAQNGQKRKK